MSNRWFRFVIALLALVAAGAAGYRIYQQERLLALDVEAVRASDVKAESALSTISEIKAALHAYVAQGQDDAFWTARAGMLLDRLRASVLDLDGPATAAGATLTETLDLTDRLAAAEQKARDHVGAGEALLAGEIVFIEARDLLDAMRLQVARARDQINGTGGVRQAAIRREQALLALGAAGVLGFAILLLAIPGRGAGSEALGLGSPTTVTTEPPPTVPAAPPAATDLTAAASVCTDLARVAQTNEISGLLGRAAQVLNATGVVVWMSSQDRSELFPAASAGYDDQLLARIGSIPRGAANVTASAFRDAAPKSSARHGSTSAALAVPLLTPLGPAGVLSAELREAAEVDATRMALASIFAAQLATLLGSIAPPVAEVTESTITPAQQAQR